MVHSFDKVNEVNSNEITYIKTSKGQIKNTTLVFKADLDILDLQEASRLGEQIAESIPGCNILTTFKGFELVGVID